MGLQYYDIHAHAAHDGVEVLLDVPFERGRSVAMEPVVTKRSLSLHPMVTVDGEWTEWVEAYREELSGGRYDAVGEVGLDKRSALSHGEQGVRMECFVRMSEELHLPLMVHCVGLYNELLALRRRMRPAQRWIIHGFRGNPEVTEQLLRAENIALSFGYYYNEQSLSRVPYDRLWVETDEAPSIEEVYQRVAQTKGIALDELLLRIENNWKNLFYR